MIHPNDFTTLGASSPEFFRQAAAERYAALQQAIATSQTTPFRQIALILGILRIGVLAALGWLLRITGKARPDELNVVLGKEYIHVPAMAVHKRIELDAFVAQDITGDCVDLGSGNGIIGALLKANSRISSMHGVDSSEAFRGDVLQRGYGGFSANDICALELPDHRFDSAVSVCVLEHVDRIDDALGEALRVLKPGGALYFSTPSPEFRSSILSYRIWKFLGRNAAADKAARERDLTSMQLHYRSAEEWKSALSEIGYEKIEITGIFSQKQLIIYEILNLEVAFPKFYMADKIFVFLSNRPKLFGISAKSIATLTSYAARLPLASGCHTHWFVKASKPL